MTRGRITRLVTTFGSGWGLIRPVGDLRELFFNTRSLSSAPDFRLLKNGLEVEFEEEADTVNGTRAIAVTIAAPPPLGGRRS